MTEEQAFDWLASRYPVSKIDLLRRFCSLIVEGATTQNLVARSTLPALWARHVVDSAQLLEVAPEKNGVWADVGSGSGFPGVVIAILSPRPVILIEPRRLRAGFLEQCIRKLGLSGQVFLKATKAKAAVLDCGAAVISARAVAPLDGIFSAALHLSDRKTVWILPKGISAASEVAMARRTWHGVFHVEPSQVDPTAGIVVASGIARR